MNNHETIFIDATVLLEAILQDRKYAVEAREFLASHTTVISPLTAHLFMYFGQKDGIEIALLFQLLARQKIVDLGAAEVDWATQHCRCLLPNKNSVSSGAL